MNRKVAAVKTAISGLIFSTLSLVLGFITQKIFIDKLGVEYSGINGVLTSIVGILTMSDLGISTAVILNLYRPLAEGNHKKVAALMRFYHRACQIIGSFILVGSIILLPFIPKIVGETSVDVNLYIVFLLFSATSAFSYFLNYRRPLLTADQKAFLINRVVTLTTFLTYLAKIAILLFCNNYYIYLSSVILFKIVENCLISFIVTKKYNYLQVKSKLDSSTKTDIKKKIFASIFHNAGSYIVFSTDNILLTTFFGVATTGVYANYSMIISSLSGILAQIFNGVSAGFGNVASKEGKDYLYIVTKRVTLLNFWLYSIAAIALYFCLNPFISLWLGEEYLFDRITTFALVFNFFLNGIRAPITGVLNAGGILYENKFVPVAESLLNLGASVLLAAFIGIPGVFIGTVISNLFLHLYAYPKYAYRLVLKKGSYLYIASFVKRVGFFLLGFFSVLGIKYFIKIEDHLLEFIVLGLISLVIPSIFYLLCFARSDDFKYYLNIIRNRLHGSK